MASPVDQVPECAYCKVPTLIDDTVYGFCFNPNDNQVISQYFCKKCAKLAQGVLFDK